MKLLLGQPVAEKIIREEILPNIKDKPRLAIIYIGNNEQSTIYINEKQKAGRRLEIEVSVYKLPADCDISEIEKTIDLLNKDTKVSGIIVQLPLPSKFSSQIQTLLNLIKPIRRLLSSLSPLLIRRDDLIYKKLDA